MSDTDFTQILYDVDDHIATITLHRPDKMNAFTGTMMREMIAAFDLTDADDDVRAVIVTGSGDRAFCAGADLSAGGETFSRGGSDVQTDAGVPRDRVIVVPDGQSGLKMVQDGRIDAYSLPVLSINDLVAKANDPNLAVVAPVVGAPVYCDGAAFRKGDEALRDAYDVELAKMKESGEFAKIIEPYGFSAAAAMSTSREKLCAAQ